MDEPNEPPPKNTLAILAEFTRRILQVPKVEVQDNDDSDGMTPIDESCPET